jgi:excinuclease UvrABC nuclease subunit
MTLINPFELPSVHLSEIKKLPDCAAIYFVICSENRILYVGQATNLVARWKNHHRQYQLEEIAKTCSVNIHLNYLPTLPQLFEVLSFKKLIF